VRSHLAISNREQRPGQREEDRETRTGSLCSSCLAAITVFPALERGQRQLEVTRAEVTEPNPKQPPGLPHLHFLLTPEPINYESDGHQDQKHSHCDDTL